MYPRVGVVKAAVSAQELNTMIDDTLLDAEEKMDKAVTVAQEDFSNIRTGRITPAVFSKVTAEYYGTQTPLNQLASFHVPEPRMITIQPFDKGSIEYRASRRRSGTATLASTPPATACLSAWSSLN